MDLRFCKVLMPSLALFAALAVNGKPPEAPIDPKTEFKVLPEPSQEFFEPEIPRNPADVPELGPPIVIRVAAGEEESEEPPRLAKRPERLTVMPREVMPQLK